MSGFRAVRVVGADLSLTSTGLSDGFTHRAVQTGPAECLESRLDRLVRGVVAMVLAPARGGPFGLEHPADLVVIEAPAWSKVSGVGHEELSALRVMVRHRLWRLGVPYALVPPTTLKRYVTGRGGASKAEMVAAVDARYGAGLAGVMVKDGRYDMADALGLAAMGYDRSGHPLPENALPVPPQRTSLNGVRWPELLSDDA